MMSKTKDKIKIARGNFLRRIASDIELDYFSDSLFGVVNNQIVGLRYLGRGFELSILISEEFSKKFRNDLRSLSRLFNKWESNIRFEGHFLILNLFSFHFTKKKLALDIKFQINDLTRIIQRYQSYTYGANEIAFYDDYPGPNSLEFREQLQSERNKLLNDTKSNLWEVFVETSLKNGSITLILLIVFGLLSVRYHISVLPLETLVSLAVFNSWMLRRLNKINLEAQIVNGVLAVLILFFNFSIKIIMYSLFKNERLPTLNEFFRTIDKNLFPMSKGVFISLWLIGLFILSIRRTLALVKVETPVCEV